MRNVSDIKSVKVPDFVIDLIKEKYENYEIVEMYITVDKNAHFDKIDWVCFSEDYTEMVNQTEDRK